MPKLISSTFSRLIEFKKTKANISILKAMNGGEGLSDEKFANLCTIVADINNNKWNTFHEVDDITIISELLYIWLDECVDYCIYPLTIIELFNVQNLFESQSETDLACYLLTHNELQGNILNTILTHIRKTLKKYEFEIIYYCAMFLKEMYPKKETYKGEIEHYEHMCEKLAIYLLGYNIDIIYENELKTRAHLNSKNVIFESIQKTMILMDFLRCNIHCSLSEEMNYDNLNEEVRVHLNQTKLSQICRSKGSIRNLLLKDNLNNNNNNNNTNNNQISNETDVNISNHNNPKERSLFGIYQLLRKHFSLKDTGNSNCNNNNNKNINFIGSSLINKSVYLNKSNIKNNNNNDNNNIDRSGSVDINESRNEHCDNFELQKQIKAYQQIMESNNTPTTNHNIHSIQPLSYNDSQEPILQLKNFHSVIKHIRKVNSRHSAGLSEQRLEHSPLIIKKKKKEFLSSIHRLGKKRSVLNIKHKFNLRTKHLSQHNNSQHIEENDLRQIDFL